MTEIRSIDLRSELERGLGSLEGERRDLRAERMDLVTRVRVLRNIVGGMEGADSERRDLLVKVPRDQKNLRIHIGREGTRLTNSIPPPMEVLKEWLSETYRRLTTIDNLLQRPGHSPGNWKHSEDSLKFRALITKKSSSKCALRICRKS